MTEFTNDWETEFHKIRKCVRSSVFSLQLAGDIHARTTRRRATSNNNYDASLVEYHSSTSSTFFSSFSPSVLFLSIILNFYFVWRFSCHTCLISN